MDNNLKNKCIISFLIYSLGDKLGFKNSDWKNSYNKPLSILTINEAVYEFIELGGINGIDISKWIVSEESLYNIAICKSLLKYKGKINNVFLGHVKNNIILVLNKINSDEKQGILRYQNKFVEIQSSKFTMTHDSSLEPYNPESQTNESASRSIPIGIAFHKDIDLLIDVSIRLSKLTHNSPIGFLSGFTVAYFAAMAMLNVDVHLWVHNMVDILESDKITKYIDKNIREIQIDYRDYVRFWKKYIDTRFAEKKPIKSRSISNLIFRIRYYYENFVRDTKFRSLGISAYCAVIIAYDALLDCDGKWEKVVFYSMLNPTESNTIGAICGGLYGIVYGYGDIPNHMLENIDDKDKIIKIGNKIYNKFCK
jgi:ADP-ribosylglycohydrolase